MPLPMNISVIEPRAASDKVVWQESQKSGVGGGEGVRWRRGRECARQGPEGRALPKELPQPSGGPPPSPQTVLTQIKLHCSYRIIYIKNNWLQGTSPVAQELRLCARSVGACVSYLVRELEPTHHS